MATATHTSTALAGFAALPATKALTEVVTATNHGTINSFRNQSIQRNCHFCWRHQGSSTSSRRAAAVRASSSRDWSSDDDDASIHETTSRHGDDEANHDRAAHPRVKIAAVDGNSTTGRRGHLRRTVLTSSFGALVGILYGNGDGEQGRRWTKDDDHHRLFLLQPASAAAPAPTGRQVMLDEQKLLALNRRMQNLNRAPAEFPGFIRDGFKVKLIAGDGYVTTEEGLIYKDFDLGDIDGQTPQDGQEVVFHYTAYNELGKRVDSSYRQGKPTQVRMGNNVMIPGFELGMKTMHVGGTRRMVVPPELGPPVGPSTFFSARQFEVFDVELLAINNCQRKQYGFLSNVVCEPQPEKAT